MIRIFTLTLFLLAPVVLNAQVGPDRYWISFTDKNNSPYSLDQPLEFLSQRALDRRALHGVDVSEQDLPVNPQYVDSIANSASGRIVNVSRWFNGMMYFTTDSAMIDSIRMFSFVREVRSLNGGTPNPKVVEKFPDEPKALELNAYYHAYYGAAYNQIAHHNGMWLHDDGYTGRDMRIAVMDAGFTNAHAIEAHQKVFEEQRVLGEKDVILGDVWVFNGSNHGTYVWSTMAGNVPGVYVGTAPDASYYLLRTEDPSREYVMEEYAWVVGAEYADSAGADIINSSLGYTIFEDASQNHTYADMDGNTTVAAIGADIAASKGMIVVTSAGNSGEAPWYYISTPADADSILTVGAVDTNAVYVEFSSKGPSADGDVKPNVAAQGGRALAVSPFGEVVAVNGTSFSSPITAGLVACLWQAHPDKTNMEIIDAIERSASLYETPNDFVGHGVPDFYLAHLLLSGESKTNEDDRLLTVYPNPMQDYLRVLFYSAAAQDGVLEIFDPTGRLVFSKALEMPANEYCDLRLDGDLAGYDQGVYVVRLSTANESFSTKVFKY